MIDDSSFITGTLLSVSALFSPHSILDSTVRFFSVSSRPSILIFLLHSAFFANRRYLFFSLSDENEQKNSSLSDLDIVVGESFVYTILKSVQKLRNVDGNCPAGSVCLVPVRRFDRDRLVFNLFLNLLLDKNKTD